MSTKELEVKKENMLTTQPTNTLDIDLSDIVIPKIIVAQSNSDVVKQKIGIEAGDIFESGEQKIIVKEGKTIEVIIVNLKKCIYSFEGEKGKEKFKAIEPYYDFFKYEEKIDNITITRHKCLSFMVFLLKDIKENGQPFPYIINFMKTNYNTGKKIVTQISKAQMFKQDYTSLVFPLKSKMLTFDRHSWYGWDLAGNCKQLENKDALIAKKGSEYYNHINIINEENKEASNSEDIDF